MKAHADEDLVHRSPKTFGFESYIIKIKSNSTPLKDTIKRTVNRGTKHRNPCTSNMFKTPHRVWSAATDKRLTNGIVTTLGMPFGAH